MTNLFTPITVLIITVLIGSFIGRIKLFGVSFGSSAVLIVGIILGLSLNSIGSDKMGSGFSSEINLLASLGTSFFMSAIGLSSGHEMANNLNKKTSKSFIVGIVMMLFGFAIMKTISHLDEKIDFSILLGIFCGATTSTPALSSICESQIISSEMAILGYGCAYPIGMIVSVLCAQLIIKRSDNDEHFSKTENQPKKTAINAFMFICISSVIGTLAGYIKLPVLNTDIGTCGGILLISAVMGMFIGKRNKNSINTYDISMFRNLGLSLFLAGNGISCGMMITTHINIKFMVYGIVISVGTILFGHILCHLAFGFKENMIAFTLAGGMTSSPSLGAIIDKSTASDLSCYSTAYLGALITNVVLMVAVK